MKKEIPDRLKSDLANIEGKYKPNYDHDTASLKPPKEILQESVERAMYDEFIGSSMKGYTSSSSSALYTNASLIDQLLSRKNNEDNNNNKSSLLLTKNNNNDKDDKEKENFEDRLLDRLTDCENDNKKLRRQLAENALKMESLEKDNKEMKSLIEAFKREKGTGTTELTEEIRYLQEDNYELNHQLEEMEAFLKDYGLVWVGNPKPKKNKINKNNNINGSNNTSDSEDNSLNSTPSQSPSPNMIESHFFDCDLFVRKVDALNKIIELEPAEIVHEDGPIRKARLVKPLEIRERIPVTLYQNGIMIKRGPFRECGSKSYISFAQDVLDGYFPSEYRNEHPDGLLLELTDRRDEIYSTSEDKSNDTMMSRTDLLKAIPSTIVHKGNIVSNRSEIELLLKNNHDINSNADSKQQDVNEIIESKSVRDMYGNSTGDVKLDNIEHDKTLLSRVQVRWLDGSKIQMKMCATDLIGDIREEVKRIKGGLDCPYFNLRSGFPSKQLSDYLSIHEAGLVPNGVVNAVADK